MPEALNFLVHHLKSLTTYSIVISFWFCLLVYLWRFNVLLATNVSKKNHLWRLWGSFCWAIFPRVQMGNLHYRIQFRNRSRDTITVVNGAVFKFKSVKALFLSRFIRLQVDLTYQTYQIKCTAKIIKTIKGCTLLHVAIILVRKAPRNRFFLSIEYLPVRLSGETPISTSSEMQIFKRI